MAPALHMCAFTEKKSEGFQTLWLGRKNSDEIMKRVKIHRSVMSRFHSRFMPKLTLELSFNTSQTSFTNFPACLILERHAKYFCTPETYDSSIEPFCHQHQKRPEKSTSNPDALRAVDKSRRNEFTICTLC